MPTHIVGQTAKVAERAAAGIDAVADQAKDVAQGAAVLAEDAAHAIAAARESAIDGVRKASVQARDLADQAYRQGKRASAGLAASVAEHPLAALLIAGAIGYALASLQRRGR